MSAFTHNSHTPHYWAITMTLTVVALLMFADPEIERVASQSPTRQSFSAIDLIYRQKYNEAIIELERVLEREPSNGEALTYLATAHLYQDLAYTKALKEFDTAFQAGGGATFVVTHSHEHFSTGQVVDYCRGWLHLRASGVEFVPIEGTHGLNTRYDELKEFKINRLSKRVFHIKIGEKNQNFRGRTNSENEALLIIALYKSFSRN